LFGNMRGVLVRVLMQNSRRTRWYDTDVENTVQMAVFRSRGRGDIAIRIPPENHRHLIIKRQHFFQYANFLAQGFECRFGFSLVRYAHLALAVISKPSDLENAGIYTLLGNIVQFLDHFKWRNRQPGFADE